jgi:hypothetical protein
MQQQDLSRFRSINAESSFGTSGKYAFIPTTRVVDTLGQQGWFPVKASEKRSRKADGFQEHLIRFRQENAGQMVAVGDILAEIVLKNSHDGLSSFQIMAGLFRLACLNGMVVADSTFATHRIKHIGYKDDQVIDAVFNVVKTTPLIMGKVEEFKQVTLSPADQMIFAETSLIAKYGVPHEDEPTIATRFNLANLALPVRIQDRLSGDRGTLAENTLWNTFNIMQEKLVERGGRFARNIPTEERPYNHGSRKARGITSVSENVRVNQALWALTEKMAELKGAN